MSELASELQSIATPITPPLPPLRQVATDSDLVGTGTLVSVRPGPAFVVDSGVPGFEAGQPTLALEIEVDHLAEGEDLVSADQPLIILRPISLGATDPYHWNDLDRTPVAFFLDATTVDEVAAAFDSTVPDPPSVDPSAVIAEPSHPSTLFAKDGDVGVALFAAVERRTTRADLSELQSLGFDVNDLR